MNQIVTIFNQKYQKQTYLIPKLSPNKNFNQEVEMDKTMRKSMGTIELCFDVDSDSDIESDNETIKKEHYSDEELGSIKVESVMTLKEFKNKEYDITECNIKLKPLNIKMQPHRRHRYSGAAGAILKPYNPNLKF